MLGKREMTFPSRLQNHHAPGARHQHNFFQQRFEFEQEEALFSNAPVGVHCVDPSGIILWANQTELNMLGFNREQYIGNFFESYVYSDEIEAEHYAAFDSSTGNNSSMRNSSNPVQSQDCGRPMELNLLPSKEKTLCRVVMKQVTSGYAIHDIPIRLVTSSGTLLHILMDCDGKYVFGSDARSSENKYFRFFMRDDNARKIQETRFNVLFQETNRSLQLMDNFMNRSMSQMRQPLILMERACDLIAENIENIDDIMRKNSSLVNANRDDAACIATAASSFTSSSNWRSLSNQNSQTNVPNIHKLSPVQSEHGQHVKFQSTNTASMSARNPPAIQEEKTGYEKTKFGFASPFNVALSATFEAKSVLGLATTLLNDALHLVDDITDLCRLDQGQVLVVEKEAVKIRDVCLEVLKRAPEPIGSFGAVEVVLDIQEGTPSRAITDHNILQRSLSLLMNFAVDAAAKAVAKKSPLIESDGTNKRATGKVILSIADSALYQQHGISSSCKLSICYTNPPDTETYDHCRRGYIFSPEEDVNRAAGGMPLRNLQEMSGTPSSLGDEIFASSSGYLRRGSRKSRGRIRDSIESGMTTCRHDKLGLGLSLAHHLVSAQGSDLRYDAVVEEPIFSSSDSLQSNDTCVARVASPSMTKFWFVLPVSLDFPERLSGERFLKDFSQQEPSRSSPFPAMNIEMMNNSAPRPIKKSRITESVSLTHTNRDLEVPVGARQKTSSNYPSLPSILTGFTTVHDNVNTNANNETTKVNPGVIPGARPLVLVVEDTDVCASLLCIHLRKLNCTSHRAENGEVALEMFRAAPSPNMYSLILMDLRMPVMDGFEAVKIIKASNACNIPVVALTGETSEEHRRTCNNIGFDDYQTKPLKPPQIKELLHKFVPGYQGPI